jgi:hypothetical protein
VSIYLILMTRFWIWAGPDSRHLQAGVEAAGGEGRRWQWGHQRGGDSLVPRNLDVQAFFLLSLPLLLTCVLYFLINRQPAPETSRRNRSTTGKRVFFFFTRASGMKWFPGSACISAVKSNGFSLQRTR